MLELTSSYRAMPGCRPTYRKAIIFKPAESRDEFEQSAMLIHKVYSEKGYISKASLPIPVAYQYQGTVTFIAKQDNEVIMTLSLISDGIKGLPMDEIYNPELEGLRSQGRRLAELSALAAQCDLIGSSTASFLSLTKLMYFNARELGIDDICIAVNPRHADFYEKKLQFECLGSLRPYPRVSNFPALAKRLDLHSFESRLKKNNVKLYNFLKADSRSLSDLGIVASQPPGRPPAFRSRSS